MIRKFARTQTEEPCDLGQPQKKVKILKWSDVGPRRFKSVAEIGPNFTPSLEQSRVIRSETTAIRKFGRQPTEEPGDPGQPQKKVKILKWSDTGPRCFGRLQK